MDNDWHKIVLVAAAFVSAALTALAVVSFMFYIPDLFK